MVSDDAPVYVISVAAELAGMHPQTLRQYDRLGIVSPGRARGRGRRYSARDIANLREVQRLSHDEGINLAGIKRILALEGEVEQLMRQVEYLRAFAEPGSRIFTADPTGDVVAVRRSERRSLRPVRGELPSHRGSLILWRPAGR
ncbi:MAG TPA: helix-turn-helix transcriptional regulator [Cellulomonas sp.]